MNTEEHIHLAGIGAYPCSHHLAHRDDETLDTIEAWCVNPELYQDIKIELRRLFNANRGFFKHTFFIAQFRVHDKHGVMLISVFRARYWDDDKRIHSFPSGELCVSINEDGLITDIVPRPKAMNPHNGRPVGPRPTLK